MASEYAVLGPHPGVTITGPHQVGVGFSGHRGLVREIGGRTERCDAGPGAVYVTGPSPITWRESRDDNVGHPPAGRLRCLTGTTRPLCAMPGWGGGPLRPVYRGDGARHPVARGSIPAVTNQKYGSGAVLATTMWHGVALLE